MENQVSSEYNTSLWGENCDTTIKTNKEVNFINASYRRYYQAHKEEILGAMQKCLEQGDFILRQDVREFEKNLAEFVGTKYAVGVNSGTDALFLSLKALGIGQGDEVITVSHVFIAPIQVIVHCGATPILIDVKEDALMDVDLIEQAITEKTKAIMPVHLSGKVCDMDRIMEIAKKHNLYVIEDACQALGAYYKGKGAGSFGDTACFSFISPKLLGCYGDGGGVVTDNQELYEKLLLLRNHWNMTQNALLGAQPEQPEIMDWGWNSRLDNIQAAVLNVKIQYYPQMLKRRKEIARMYREGLKDLPIILPTEQSEQVWQEYILGVTDRDKFAEHMKKNGVELLIRDTIPNHKLKGLGLEHFNLPITEKKANLDARLPIYPELTDEEVEYVIKVVRSFYAK